MKVYVYIRASERSPEGWQYTFVEETYHGNWYEEDKDFALVTVIEVPKPDIAHVVSVGSHHLEEMQKNHEELHRTSLQNIKEYESKFILLEAPLEDN